MGISVDYSVINAELTELNIMLNDNYVQVAASKLGSEISYSQSDYVDVLLDQVDTIKNIHKIMNGIIEDSMKMLTMARKIYSDGDIEIRDLISQEGEQDILQKKSHNAQN